MTESEAKVLFTRVFSSEEPQIGWIVSNTYHKWREHPYLITTDENVLNECKNNETYCQSITDSTEGIYRGHEDLIAPYSLKLYTRIKKQISKYNKSLFLKNNINITYYNKISFNGSSIGIYTCVFLNMIKSILYKMYNFLIRVALLGTVWIIFDNFIQIYQGQYKKYLLSRKIKELKKNDYIMTYLSDGQFIQKKIMMS